MSDLWERMRERRPTLYYDPSLVDILDWRLGAGQGRLLMLGIAADSSYAKCTALEALHDCCGEHHSVNGDIKLHLDNATTWDGETLRTPGEWPETLIHRLPGMRLRSVIDHPALPERPIVSVEQDDDFLLIRTDRPDPFPLDDPAGPEVLRSPTLSGRLRDEYVIQRDAIRFVRSRGMQKGITPSVVCETSVTTACAISLAIAMWTLHLAQSVPSIALDTMLHVGVEIALACMLALTASMPFFAMWRALCRPTGRSWQKLRDEMIDRFHRPDL